ncbi:MAG: hypothetical protein ACTIA6_06290 [Pseudoclavibacter sp.]
MSDKNADQVTGIDQAESAGGAVARRRVLGAAAWATPVIALTVAAPAQATSGPEFPIEPHVATSIHMGQGSYTDDNGSFQAGLLIVWNPNDNAWATFTSNVPGATVRVLAFEALYHFDELILGRFKSAPGWTSEEIQPDGTVRFTAVGAVPSPELQVSTPAGGPVVSTGPGQNSFMVGRIYAQSINWTPPGRYPIDYVFTHTYTYEVTDASGDVTTVTKTVNGQGSVIWTG